VVSPRHNFHFDENGKITGKFSYYGRRPHLRRDLALKHKRAARDSV